MSPYMADQMADSMESMQTPVSPVSAQSSPHDTTMGDQQQQMTRKRSHSVMSQQQHATTDPHPAHSRAPSIHSQTGGPEDFSPRGSRAYKRGDPPTNDQGKYICDYGDECFGQIFDRKCEWSKHMDKHDRPYRCPHPSCAKLQGFTYSGGLLRHEREVHGKHGGPKSQLMCPFTDCKRHSGKGFTRKENLNEHLRRVHQGKETASQQQDPLLERNSADVAPGADGDDTQMSHMSTGVKDEMSQLATGLKRKRSMPPQSQDDYGASHLVETSDQELARLRADNALQADRIRQLEATVAMNAEEMQRLKETMNLWAQQTGGQNHHVQHEQQQQHQQHPELDHQQHEEHHHQQQQEEHHHHHHHHHQFAQHQQIVQQLLEYAQPQDAEQQQHEDQKFAEQLAQQAEPVVPQENTLAAEVKAAFAAQEA